MAIKVSGSVVCARALLALAALLSSWYAPGQEPDAAPPPPNGPPSLTLQEAEQRAADTSPALRAAAARVRLEEGRLRQARLYPNPDLSLDATRFTDGSGPKETILALRQPIPYHSKRALDRRTVQEMIDAAQRDLDRDRLDLLLEVRQSYYRLHFTAQILKVEEESLEATQALRRAVDARVAAGDAPPFEALKAQVEVARAESQVSRARGELAAQTASFNLLLGQPAEAPTTVAEPDLDLAPAEPLATLQERALQDQPEIRSRIHLAQAAEFSADRARLERRPDISVGPTIGVEEGSSFAGAGVSLRLPVWNHSQGIIAAAEAGRDAALAEVDAARLAVSRLVAESYGRYRSARSQRELFEQGLLEQAARLLETARRSYEGGESGVLELLDARRTALAVREEYYRASLDAALAAAQLRRSVGLDAQGPP